MEEKLQTPGHRRARKFLRVLGPLVALLGLGFLGVGLISFFSAFGSFEPPRLFWCAFVGMPILFIGIVLCKFAFFGAVLRYVAAESAPVAADTVNYMAEETRDSVRKIAKAAAKGIREGNPPRE